MNMNMGMGMDMSMDMGMDMDMDMALPSSDSFVRGLNQVKFKGECVSFFF